MVMALLDLFCRTNIYILLTFMGFLRHIFTSRNYLP